MHPDLAFGLGVAAIILAVYLGRALLAFAERHYKEGE